MAIFFYTTQKNYFDLQTRQVLIIVGNALKKYPSRVGVKKPPFYNPLSFFRIVRIAGVVQYSQNEKQSVTKSQPIRSCLVIDCLLRGRTEEEDKKLCLE